MNCGRISNCNAGALQGLERGPRTQSPRGAGRADESQRAQATGRAQVKTRTDSSTLTLKVQTDEGDTVEISLAAQSQQTSAKASWREGDNTAKISQQSSSNSFSAQIKVDGDLSDQEVADIQHLLESLGSGGQAENVADNSLASYDYSFTRTREVSRQTLEVFG